VNPFVVVVFDIILYRSSGLGQTVVQVRPSPGTQQIASSKTENHCHCEQLNGIEATRQIKSELPEVKILALSVHAKREFVLDMVRAGVSGYMIKEYVLDDLVRAIKVVMDNQSYLSPQIVSIVPDGITKDSIFDSISNWYELLSPREKQILQLLTEGHSAKQVLPSSAWASRQSKQTADRL